ncbi:MAG: DUF4190 domain-containing protein [Kiritimatiellaeota bacterium]|nr:DUF4190 domain-containing protein [Kiritimatiellota bacterium]
MSEERPIEEDAVNEENVVSAEPVAMTEEPVAAAAEETAQMGDAVTSVPMPTSGAQKTDVLAIVALVFGISSIVFGVCCGLFAALLPIAAIICGFISKGKIAKDPNLKGGGMALTGIILGFVSIVVIGLVTMLGVANAIMNNMK